MAFNGRDNTQRERLAMAVLKRNGEFTSRDVRATVPGVPNGTVSSLLTLMHKARLISIVRIEGMHTNVYTVNAGVPSEWRTIHGRLARADTRTGTHPRATNGARRRRRQRGVTDYSAVQGAIQEWRRKAAMLDRLIADLKLTDADLRAYRA